MTTIEAVSAAFNRTLSSEPRGSGEVLTLPLGLSNGNLVQIYVEQLASDRWLVSDRGQAAFELAIAGVNIETQKAANASWQHLVRSILLDAPIMLDTQPHELAGTSTGAELGNAVLLLGEAVLRGEGLCALAPSYRTRKFRDVIVQAAGKQDLAVQLDAPMPTRHGGNRSVSLAVQGQRPTFVQAVSGRGSAIDGFDKAQAVFSSADVPRDQLVAVLASRVHLAPWQWETLRERGNPIMESELDHFMSNLVA
ncbi:hypothetical protein NOCA2210003 [metagenome]|uniref:Uncharacterized protein n=1 Tax=metagenome TaxID=256318 RepID=A0A2P2BY55_9ZZZZ